MTELSIDGIVDPERYPIGEPSDPRTEALIEEAAERFRTDGVCLFPEFLKPGAVEAMAREVEMLSPEAFRCDDRHNAYLEADDGAFPEGHPRRQLQHTRLDVLGCDQLSAAGALWTLFRWDGLSDFLRRILGLDRLFRFEDPVGAITVNVMRDGDGHGWHYDEAQFTVSVMLQASLRGGEFEYVPGLRGESFDDYDGLKRVLAGDRSKVSTIPITPGALMLFSGRHLLHRVSNVGGSRTRHIVTFSYRDRPGMMNSPEVRMLFFGRRGAVKRSTG